MGVLDAPLVGGAVLRKFVADVEKIDGDLIVLLTQHAGHSQRITAIIARSREDDHGLLIVPFRSDGARQGFGCAFHEIDGANGFMLHGIMVKFVDLIAGKNLHLGTKIQK